LVVVFGCVHFGHGELKEKGGRFINH